MKVKKMLESKLWTRAAGYARRINDKVRTYFEKKRERILIENLREGLVGNCKREEDEPILRRLIASTDTTVSKNAIITLKEMKSWRAIPFFVEASKSPDVEIRRAVACAIEMISYGGRLRKNEQTVEILVSLVNDEDRVVKLAAIDALGRVGDEKALITLIRAIDSRDEELTRAVLYAISVLEIDMRIKLKYIDKITVKMGEQGEKLRAIVLGTIMLNMITTGITIEDYIGNFNSRVDLFEKGLIGAITGTPSTLLIQRITAGLVEIGKRMEALETAPGAKVLSLEGRKSGTESRTEYTEINTYNCKISGPEIDRILEGIKIEGYY